MADVTIYTRPDCPYCAAAKQFYTEQGIPVEEINVRENPEAQEKVVGLTGGRRALPIVIENGELMIGFTGC